MPFQPGNQLGKKYGLWRAALDRAIVQEDGKRLRAAAEKLLDMAAEGDLGAIKELGDRIDGKPAQAVIMSGDEDAAPVQVRAVIEFVGREVATSDDDDSRRAVEPEHSDSQAT